MLYLINVLYSNWNKTFANKLNFVLEIKKNIINLSKLYTWLLILSLIFFVIVRNRRYKTAWFTKIKFMI